MGNVDINKQNEMPSWHAALYSHCYAVDPIYKFSKRHDLLTQVLRQIEMPTGKTFSINPTFRRKEIGIHHFRNGSFLMDNKLEFALTMLLNWMLKVASRWVTMKQVLK